MPTMLIYVVVTLVIVGVILWAITQFPIDATLAKLIRVVVVVACVIWLCYLLLGFVGSGVQFPRVR